MTTSTDYRGHHRHPLTMKALRGDRYAHARQDLPITEIAVEARLEDGGVDRAGSPAPGEPGVDVDAYVSWRLVMYGLMIFVGVVLICTAALAALLVTLLPWG